MGFSFQIWGKGYKKTGVMEWWCGGVMEIQLGRNCHRDRMIYFFSTQQYSSTPILQRIGVRQPLLEFL
jgi:hypothetical protein